MDIQLINELISALLQIGVFILIPFIVFLFRKSKTESFQQYIGLIRPTSISIRYSIFISLLFLSSVIVLLFLDDNLKQIMLEPPSITGKLRGMPLNFNTVMILLIIALFKTSLSEEILFRGFIANRLMNWLGYKRGNVLQALIFGLVHLLLFWLMTRASVSVLLFIFGFSTFAGYCIGFIKEKYAHGSIIPGWIAHGLGNALSYSIIAFVI